MLQLISWQHFKKISFVFQLFQLTNILVLVNDKNTAQCANLDWNQSQNCICYQWHACCDYLRYYISSPYLFLLSHLSCGVAQQSSQSPMSLTSDASSPRSYVSPRISTPQTNTASLKPPLSTTPVSSQTKVYSSQMGWLMSNETMAL